MSVWAEQTLFWGGVASLELPRRPFFHGDAVSALRETGRFEDGTEAASLRSAGTIHEFN